MRRNSIDPTVAEGRRDHRDTSTIRCSTLQRIAAVTRTTRRYRSRTRQEHAAATRTAILRAFADQLGRPGATELSPAAAARAAGVSIRSVHAHFPDLASRLAGVAAYVDEVLGLLPPVDGVDDLADHVRRVYRRAGEHLALVRALATASRADTARARRTRGRHLDISALLVGIGAPPEPTRRAVAAVCMLAEADALVPLVDVHGLDPEEAAEAAAYAVEAIVADLRARRDAKLAEEHEGDALPREDSRRR